VCIRSSHLTHGKCNSEVDFRLGVLQVHGCLHLELEDLNEFTVDALYFSSGGDIATHFAADEL